MSFLFLKQDDATRKHRMPNNGPATRATTNPLHGSFAAPSRKKAKKKVAQKTAELKSASTHVPPSFGSKYGLPYVPGPEVVSKINDACILQERAHFETDLTPNDAQAMLDAFNAVNTKYKPGLVTRYINMLESDYAIDGCADYGAETMKFTFNKTGSFQHRCRSLVKFGAKHPDVYAHVQIVVGVSGREMLRTDPQKTLGEQMTRAAIVDADIVSATLMTLGSYHTTKVLPSSLSNFTPEQALALVDGPYFRLRAMTSLIREIEGSYKQDRATGVRQMKGLGTPKGVGGAFLYMVQELDEKAAIAFFNIMLGKSGSIRNRNAWLGFYEDVFPRSTPHSWNEKRVVMHALHIAWNKIVAGDILSKSDLGPAISLGRCTSPYPPLLPPDASFLSTRRQWRGA
ncbi:hypothetical protein [Methylocystis hirsuta]|nr:hypothetical protein [Methylocystis hirsuta]